MQEEIYLYIELLALHGIIQRIILKRKYFTIQGVRVQSWNVPLPEVAVGQSLLNAGHVWPENMLFVVSVLCFVVFF